MYELVHLMTNEKIRMYKKLECKSIYCLFYSEKIKKNIKLKDVSIPVWSSHLFIFFFPFLQDSETT